MCFINPNPLTLALSALQSLFSFKIHVHTQVETYRQYTGNLDMIVSAYNRVLTSMLPVEEPLLANNIEAIDKTLKMGIEVGAYKCEYEYNLYQLAGWSLTRGFAPSIYLPICVY